MAAVGDYIFWLVAGSAAAKEQAMQSSSRTDGSGS